MIHPSVKLGKHCVIGDCEISEGVVIKDFAFIGDGAKIGKNVTIGRYCEVREGCVIGENSSFGSRCTLSAGTIIGKNTTVKYSFVATDTPDMRDLSKKTTNVIGDNCVFGANVTLMPGVKVEDNAIIGACSQVRHDVGEGEIWYGSPAKKMK